MERSNDRLVAAFAGVLRERRERAGLTQEDLAERANVSARFVSFLETGRRQPSLSALASLSSGLGISMTDIVSELEARYRETAQR
jgi:transcriptional regulator with XRE-family HTH domain